jgi:hypothetical protein
MTLELNAGARHVTHPRHRVVSFGLASMTEGLMRQNEPSTRPWWVKVTLWGLPNRSAALVFVWFCVAVATAFVLLGFRDRRFSWGAVWLMPALGYLRAIRWVDKHGGWS